MAVNGLDPGSYIAIAVLAGGVAWLGASKWLSRRADGMTETRPLAPVTPPPPPPIPPVAAPVRAEQPPAHTATQEQVSDAFTRVEQKLQLMERRLEQIGGATAPHPPSPANPHAASLAPEVRDDVYRLADTGADSAEIARWLAISRGEVELLLALREARSRTV